MRNDTFFVLAVEVQNCDTIEIDLFKFDDFNLKLELNLNCALLCKTFCTIKAKICIATVILFLKNMFTFMKTTGQRLTYQLSEKLYQQRPTRKHR